MMTIKLYAFVRGVGTPLEPVTVTDEIGNQLVCNGQGYVLSRDAAKPGGKAGVIVKVDRVEEEEPAPQPVYFVEAPETEPAPEKPTTGKKKDKSG